MIDWEQTISSLTSAVQATQKPQERLDYTYVCMRCHTPNNHFKWVCEGCDNLEQIAEGELQDD